MKRQPQHLARFAIAGLSLFCINSFANAQDESPTESTVGEAVEMTVIAGDDTGAAPMIFATSESFEGGESTGLRFMSGGSGGMSFLGNMGGNIEMPAPDPWGMLSNPSVQKDLELVGDQLKKVKDLQAKFADQMKAQIGDITEGGLDRERLKDLPELIKKLKAEQREQMESMLLPHQVDRLKQVALQTHMKQAGTANALKNAEMAAALGITEEQIEKLKTRNKEINERLAKDMAKLKADAKNDLLQVLTPDQQKKLKEMTGDKYEQKNEDWQEMISGRRNSRKMQLKNGR